jgi:hypothetical protein
MFDEHLNRQHRLAYMVRGPEWAFAVPQGSLDALEEIFTICSGFWNGVGSLLVPVTRNGRLPGWVDGLLEVRPVDHIYVHPGVTEQAMERLRQRVGNASRLRAGFDDREVHPLLLLGPSKDQPRPLPPIEFPLFKSRNLRRVAAAAWGVIPADDLEEWQPWFHAVQVDGEDAHGALLRGQVADAGASPLLLSGGTNGIVHQVSPLDTPSLWIFGESAGFRELVNFWNFRSRSMSDGRAPVIGLPQQALSYPAQLEALHRWLPRIPGSRKTPDLFVNCEPRHDQAVQAALTQAGFAEETSEKLGKFSFGRDVTPNDPPTFALVRPLLGGPFVRGAHASELVAFSSGRASTSLPAPKQFLARSGANTRVVFRNLPLPLPATPAAARRINPNATASDGVMVLTSAMTPWNFDITLPSAWEALTDYAADRGFQAEWSRDGRDANALLQRLGNLERIELLRHRLRVAILEALAPINRHKWARAIAADAAQAGEQLDEGALVEELSQVGLFLELEARTANQIATRIGPGTRKADVLRELPSLVETGFVTRARSLECPSCRFRHLLRLDEQAERVRCRACGHQFTMPVVDNSGEREPESFYRLDGLMARAMDQAVLPVLFALRTLRTHLGGELFFAWPGVLLRGAGQDPVDADVVASNGERVFCCEVKTSASGLGQPQLVKLMALSRQLEARPVIAALKGSFEADIVSKVLEAGGLVLTEADLLASG